MLFEFSIMPLELQRIHALCFDVDGTLSDTDDQVVDTLARALRLFQWLYPKKDITRFARHFVMALETPGNFLIGLPDIIGLDDEIFALYDFLARKINTKPKQFQLVPGVREMLLELHGRYPLAVVSARDERTTKQFLEQFNLIPLFKSIAVAQTCKHTKPFPDPILWVAEQMGVPPEKCLMIGDTTVDIRAGKAAGAQTVGVLCGFGERDELLRTGANLILETTSDLLGVLRLSNAT